MRFFPEGKTPKENTEKPKRKKSLKTSIASELPLFDVVDLSFIFHDVTGKPFNGDRPAIRLLNSLMDKNRYITAELPIHILRATQPRVNRDYAKAARRYSKQSTGYLPAVVKYQGIFYVTDGHHRIVAKHSEGSHCVKVRLFDLDEDTQTDMPLIEFLER